MPAKSFSFPSITKHDLENPSRLNELLRLLGQELSKTQGGQGPFNFQKGPFTFNGQASFPQGIHAPSLKTFESNAAAQAGGLTAGQMYRTPSGSVMIVY